MNQAEFGTKLLLAGEDPAEIAALAREVVEDLRYPAAAGLQRLATEDEAARELGKELIAEAGPLALGVLAEAPQMRHRADEILVLRSMGEEMLKFRRDTATAVRAMLTDRQKASAPLPGSNHKVPRGARNCDLAYILLHRLLHIESSPNEFFALPPPGRDEEIVKFQESRPFTAAFE